jgi:hypothetical protein
VLASTAILGSYSHETRDPDPRGCGNLNTFQYGLNFFWRIYSNSVRTSQETHYVSATEANRLICLEKQSLCFVRIIRNIQIQPMRGMQSFSVKLGGTFECYIPLRIYLTDSLWRRQSQQSFNTLTPLISFFTHYMFRPLRAILRWDIPLAIIVLQKQK